MAKKKPKQRRDDPPAPARGPLVEIGIGIALLVGLAAALQVLEIALGRSPLGAAIAGAVIVDLGASWGGLRWSEEDRKPWTTSAAWVLRGAAVALILVAIVVAASVALGWARVGLGQPGGALALGVIRSAAIGTRDELLYRGVPLMAAARAGVPDRPAVGFAAITSAAAIALVPGATIGAVALAAGTGLLFAVIWKIERGAWAAVGAHAALALGAGTLIRGGLLDVIFSRGNFVLGPRADGAPAWLGTAVAIAFALALPRIWSALRSRWKGETIAPSRG